MNHLELTERTVITRAKDGSTATDAPSWTAEIDNPYLHGVYSPTTVETEAEDLEITSGEIPKDLYGAYLRNGPNPVFNRALITTHSTAMACCMASTLKMAKLTTAIAGSKPMPISKKANKALPFGLG